MGCGDILYIKNAYSVSQIENNGVKLRLCHCLSVVQYAVEQYTKLLGRFLTPQYI